MSSRCLVRDVLIRCEVDPPHGFEWFGRRIEVTGGMLQQEEPRRSFVRALATHLYLHVYCHGEILAHPPSSEAHTGGEIRALQTAHSLANRDRNRWDDGWTFAGTTRGLLLVRKDGIEFTVSREGVRRPEGASLEAGCPVEVLVPAERWFRSPGYMLFYGQGIPRSTAAGIRRTRYYFDLDVDGARRMIGLGRRLNDADVSFMLKVAGHPAAYSRCDTVVLFLEKDDYSRAGEILLGGAAEFRRGLRRRTPAFTRRIVPGVGISDDPGDGESFGESRCRLLVEGILRAHEAGARTVKTRMDAVEETFLGEGVSLDRAHLEQGSREYDFIEPDPDLPTLAGSG